MYMTDNNSDDDLANGLCNLNIVGDRAPEDGHG